MRRASGRRVPVSDARLIAFVADPDAEYESWFGQPKASGEFLVAGAHGDDHSGLENPGTAYVFERTGDSWTLQQTLTAFDAAEGDFFGYTVDISGDTIAVGSPHVDHSGIESAGAVYVYTRTADSWSLQQRLTAGSPYRSDFGRALGLDGDTLVVGTWAGRAYVFTREEGVWTERHEFSTPNPDSEGGYGGAVAIGGGTIVVGSGEAYNRGSVYVYEFEDPSWVYKQELTASDVGEGDYFGGMPQALAVFENTILIGSPGHDHSGSSDAGAAYLYTRTERVWTETEKIISAASAQGDCFGHSVALTRDRALIGAWGPWHSLPPGMSSVSFYTVTGNRCVLRQRTEAIELGLGGIGWKVALDGRTAYADGYPPPTNPDIGAIFVFE